MLKNWDNSIFVPCKDPHPSPNVYVDGELKQNPGLCTVFFNTNLQLLSKICYIKP